jgi:hypothetical protein
VGRTEVHQPDTSGHPAGLSIRRSAQLSHFSKRVTRKLASSYVERNAIFKLRYQSYFRTGLVSQNSFGRYIEPADHADNAYLMGLCIDRRLVSSLRLQIGSLATPIFSSLELFPDVLEPILRNGQTVVDMSCVATDGELARKRLVAVYDSPLVDNGRRTLPRGLHHSGSATTTSSLLSAGSSL